MHTHCGHVVLCGQSRIRAIRKNRAPHSSSFEILSGSGVDADNIALVDEERNLDLGSGLDGRRLGRTGRGIAADAGLGSGNLKSNEHGRLDGKYVSVVGSDLAHVVLLHELEVCGELVGVERKLLEGLHVHEVVEIAVVVEILHLAAVDARVLEFVGGVEGRFGDRTGDHVLELGANECCTLARLNVLEFDDLHDLSVHVEGYTVFEIACYYHKIKLSALERGTLLSKIIFIQSLIFYNKSSLFAIGNAHFFAKRGNLFERSEETGASLPRNGDRAPHFSQNERERGRGRENGRLPAVDGENARRSSGGECIYFAAHPREFSEVLPSAVPSREAEKGGRKALPSPFGIIPYFVCGKLRPPSENQTMPCAIIASATLRKPAMFAPATKLPFIPYFSHASETFL